ncbi:helix-turn-helix transcriptional regulator [Bifidobacterium sp. ESL0800]|uniref:helix-turn-helix domain-containing protein n=1 Tax=Bifidobacterium sp. ESL0800 TaxID=2983236 RepID=UPI0023F814EA|nr:helix-turn-helix transcriptional regulator [Bifidobacterium sp. ESL0800]WEV75301.1 helix-turn-helix transcriptional regulator [Bifidobacterium sp. ESL0800]
MQNSAQIVQSLGEQMIWGGSVMVSASNGKGGVMAVEMRLGGQIREHREAMGLSQDDLAGRIFVSRQTVSNWETGRTYPDVQNLLLLGNLFGITLDELVKGDVETMNEEIKRNGTRILTLFIVGCVFIAAGLVMTVLMVVKGQGPAQAWRWFAPISMVLYLCGLIAVGWCYKLQRDIDVLTYKELRQYLAGDEVDRSSRKGKPLSTKQIVVIAIICAFVGAVMGLFSYKFL